MKALLVALTVAVGFSASANESMPKHKSMSLVQLISAAIDANDDLKASRHLASAQMKLSQSVDTWPEPTIKFAVQNMPLSASLSQENMTQTKVSVQQAIPQGDTIEINQQQHKLKQHSQQINQQLVILELKKQVTDLFLQGNLAQQAVSIIAEDLQLFEQLIEISNASYSANLGKTRQQDIIRAQLQLLQLQQTQAQWQQKLAVVKSQLITLNKLTLKAEQLQLKHSLPYPVESLDDYQSWSTNQWALQLAKHPKMLLAKNKSSQQQQQLLLEKQKLKAKWGLEAGYGYRADNNMGQSRDDLFSVGVSVQLPLFTKNNKRQAVAAQTAKKQAALAQQNQTLTLLTSQAQQWFTQAASQQQQLVLYRQLLNQAQQHAETAMTAYTNDDGQFSDVVTAKQTLLQTQLAQIQLQMAQQQSLNQLNYFIPADLAVGAHHE